MNEHPLHIAINKLKQAQKNKAHSKIIENLAKRVEEEARKSLTILGGANDCLGLKDSLLKGTELKLKD